MGGLEALLWGLTPYRKPRSAHASLPWVSGLLSLVAGRVAGTINPYSTPGGSVEDVTRHQVLPECGRHHSWNLILHVTQSYQ